MGIQTKLFRETEIEIGAALSELQFRSRNKNPLHDKVIVEQCETIKKAFVVLRLALEEKYA